MSPEQRCVEEQPVGVVGATIWDVIVAKHGAVRYRHPILWAAFGADFCTITLFIG